MGTEAIDWHINLVTSAISRVRYMGGAVQWDPYEWYDLTEVERQRLYDRVSELNLSFVRCLVRAYWYCKGFDEGGELIFDWESRRMQKLYEVLDFCQQRGIKVLLGDWHAPWFDVGTDPVLNKLSLLEIGTDDERWVSMNIELLRHLIRRRGYSCIAMFNLCNEPNISRSVQSFDEWAEGIRLMSRGLKSNGLDRHVRLAGPDTFLNGNDWLVPAMEQLSEELDIYEVHLYAARERLRNGDIENELRALREQVSRYQPNRVLFLGEAGISTGVVEGDKQPNTRKYWYGVAMADLFVQALSAGFSGVVAWNLDDCIHLNNVSDPSSYNLKVWGFWNSIGGRMGYPGEEEPRPWYYVWRLLSNSFREQARLLELPPSAVPGLRIMAAWMGEGNERQLSCVIVNHSELERGVRVEAPWSTMQLPLRLYTYGPEERAWEGADRNVTCLVELFADCTLRVAANSVAVLTTLKLEFGEE